MKCQDKVFDCHQFMLSARYTALKLHQYIHYLHCHHPCRSPVFRAMFQADMAEKKTKKVDIQDLHPDVVAEMLQFIYSGNTPNLNR